MVWETLVIGLPGSQSDPVVWDSYTFAQALLRT